jgi:hypothetical protein
MVGPQHLGPIVELDRLKGCGLGMARGEGKVTGGVPVLDQDAVRKVMDESIDKGNDLIAGRDFERAPRAEIVLDVDDEKTVS